MQDFTVEGTCSYQFLMQRCQKQLNEAHEIAALNLTKYRKAQQELEEIEARNAAQEQEIAKAKLQ